MSKWMSFAIGVCMLSLFGTACQKQDTHHEVQSHSRDGLLGITEVNPNNPLGATYRTYTDDLRVMDQAVKAQLPVVKRTNISLNGSNAHVRLDVPAGTDQATIERIRAQAQETLAAAVPRYKYKVSVAVK
ncbi:hypothetical protein ACFQI7_31180 [Paenibacillus allorhizosphaerae]|uniref:Sporulation protein n=1 Tax=Paenibacillus allorhizosphaerae TaxID=2849866 RepID=A0ABN7TRM0_9BACL|nr:hypothetical protein [Paenibacillus allorhizosphaerae]CAG7652894.1 hypothetical protein PAECIP111802_05348 [Paenibacillus allorhizosphaerae]